MYILSLVKSLRPHRREHWIVLSILVYSLVGVLKYYMPNTLCNALVALSAFIFIMVVCRHASGFYLKGITGLSYAILILWSLCLTFHMFFIADIRSTFVEYHGLTTWLLAYFGSPMFLPNLIPFVLLVFPRNYQFDFRYLWRVMWLLCILYMCYYPFAFWNMTHYSWSFDDAGLDWGEKGTYGDFISNSTRGIASLLPIVIMVYLKKYLPQKNWRWFLATYVGNILIAAFMARRGGLAMSVLYLVLAGMMYSLNDKRTSKIKMILMATIVVGVIFVLFTNLSDSFFSTNKQRKYYKKLFSLQHEFIMKTHCWDFVFVNTGWIHNALAVFPSRNLVENIGLDGVHAKQHKKAPYNKEVTFFKDTYEIVNVPPFFQEDFLYQNKVFFTVRYRPTTLSYRIFNKLKRILNNVLW